MHPKNALQRKKHPNLPNFCSFCSISFENHSTFKHHMNTQHMETQMCTQFFHCFKCDYKTDHKRTFDHHSLKHTISQFECNQCQMPFLKKENLFMHLKLKHSNTDTTTTTTTTTTPSQCVWHQCPHCQYKSSFKSLMNRHIYKHNVATYSCDICQMPFINKANIFYHMESKHSNESEVLSSSVYSKVRWDMKIQHCRESYECKICDLLFPSQMELEEHNKKNHSNTNNGSNHFEFCSKNSLSTDDPTNQCFYCPYCLNRLDTKSFLIHNDASNYICPTCNMAFSRQLLMEQNVLSFESKEPNFTHEESFTNFPENTEMHHHLSVVQHMEEIYKQTEDLQNSVDVRSKNLDNNSRQVDQINLISSIDFIEIDDDDDDDAGRIDVDANEKLNYFPALPYKSSDKTTNSNVCIEDTNQCDPLIGSSNETLSTLEPSTSINQSNVTSKRGRFIKLVSDFDDFAERPYACALCYQRYSQFKQLEVHVKNHLTGAGCYEGVIDSIAW